jgi:cation diffusion facilitator family transporter
VKESPSATKVRTRRIVPDHGSARRRARLVTDHHGHEGHAHHHDEHPPDEHEHDDHEHDDHEHGPPQGLVGRLRHLVTPHSHDAALAVDPELEASRRGTRALLISFLGLTATAVLQALVFLVSGSVALLVDTIHNGADALTAVPIAVAFTLGRRAPTRRYTYGYGRSEDLAGIVVVVVIAASAVLAAVEAVRRLAHPQDLDHLGLLALAGAIGFMGNEAVARYRISVGRDIGSAALVADGLHARTDGFTSLAVVVSALGAWAGLARADPVVGLLIVLAVLAVLRDAARDVYRRLMDAVDPELVDLVERTARGTEGVRDVGDVRLRWIGHRLRAELEIVVADDLSLVAAHRVAEATEHRLLHDVPRLHAALVHADPDGVPHDLTGHHRPGSAAD